MRKFPAGTEPCCGRIEGKPFGRSSRIPCAEPSAAAILRMLSKQDAVFVRGVGAIIRAADPDDREALRLLTEKSALCALHAAGLGVKAHLSGLDAALMHLIYQKKYAKRKG